MVLLKADELLLNEDTSTVDEVVSWQVSEVLQAFGSHPAVLFNLDFLVPERNHCKEAQ